MYITHIEMYKDDVATVTPLTADDSCGVGKMFIYLLSQTGKLWKMAGQQAHSNTGQNHFFRARLSTA